jgi:hypothetical protein
VFKKWCLMVGSVGTTALNSGDPWFIVSWKTGYPGKNFFTLPETFLGSDLERLAAYLQRQRAHPQY